MFFLLMITMLSVEVSSKRYIYNGDSISLKSVGRKTSWASCYGQAIRKDTDHCTTEQCPLDDMSGMDWYLCEGEVFRVTAKDKSSGEQIKSGDIIALQFTWNSTQFGDLWLSCDKDGKQCETSSCPGAIYNFYQKPVCRSEMFRIFIESHVTATDLSSTDNNEVISNTPAIVDKDTILIWSSRTYLTDQHFWLTSTNNSVMKTVKRLGNNMTELLENATGNDKWKIFVR